MKHIILPFCDSLGREYDYLAAYPNEEKKSAGIIFHTENDQPRVTQRGKDNVCWKYEACMTSPQAAENLRAILESHRASVDPEGNDRITADIVFDAANIEKANTVLNAIHNAVPWILIHVILLSEHYSDYGKQQSTFFASIRKDAEGKAAASELKWTWFTMLADENSNGVVSETIRQQREILLPLLFRDEHTGEMPHTCYTYAVRYRKMHFEKIPSIPHIQSLRHACAMMQASDAFNEYGILLMNNDIGLDDSESQTEILQKNLLRAADFRPISGLDLLINKHDPKADCTTRELLEKVLRDNPDYDARQYDQAETEEELLSLRLVNKAVDAWEDYVVEYAKMHTGLERLRNQLMNNSEWAKRISQDFQANYMKQNPLDMVALTLKGKDGFEDAAVSKAEGELAAVNRQLRDAIYQACLRLMVLRLHQTYRQVESIIRTREETIDDILKTLNETKDAEEMTANWCDTIQKKLKDASAKIPLHIEPEKDTRVTIEDYANLLLNYIQNTISDQDGYKEIASPDHVNKMMKTIHDTTNPLPLVSPQLTSGGCLRKDDLWFISNLLHPTWEAERTQSISQPMIINLTRFYLYPAADTAPDPEKEDYTYTLFKGIAKPLIGLEDETEPSSQSIKQNIADGIANKKEKETEKSSLEFFWLYDQADSVHIDFYLYGESKPFKSIQKSKMDFGGSYVVRPIADLPSGARFEIEVVFIQKGHDIGKYPKRLYYETTKEYLYAEPEEIKIKMGTFNSKIFTRLRIRERKNMTGRIGIMNAESGCLCSDITWFTDGRDSVSEPLPNNGCWCLANLPESPFVYQLEN